MTLGLRIGAAAERQIHEASAWWDANRPAAPGLLRLELRRAFEIITEQPGVGAPYLDEEFADLRRIHLPRIRYHVYYRVRNDDTIEVLAFWHTSRGQGPSFEGPA